MSKKCPSTKIFLITFFSVFYSIAFASQHTILNIDIKNASSKLFKVALYGTGDLNDYRIHEASPNIPPGENGNVKIEFKAQKNGNPMSVHHTLILSQENRSCTVEYTTSTTSNAQYYLLTAHQLHFTLDNVENEHTRCKAWVEEGNLLKIEVADSDEEVEET